MRGRFGAAATWVAAAAALLWTAHPLQTESVTYLVQRTESLMGLFYLLTLYCVIRGAASRAAEWWYVAAVTACAAGMASKEVMVTAPLIVWLFDVVFLSSSPSAAWKARRWLYLAMAATWVLLAALLASTGARGGTVGMGLEKVRPWEYAVTQPGILLHYLRLAFWPAGQCLDYSWPVARSARQILPGAVAIAALLAVSAWALAPAWRRRGGVAAAGAAPVVPGRVAWGFLGAWFFVILAPTSSIVPIADLAFEHRMYLSLAAVTSAVAVGGYLAAAALIRRGGLRRPVRGAVWAVAAVLAAGAAGALGWATFLRNYDYRNDWSIYEDAARKYPQNARAHSNLGFVLIGAGQLDRAMEECNRALQISPDFPDALNNRGLVYATKGQHDKAIADYNRVLQLQPDHSEAYNNRGASYAEMNRYAEALADYIRAVKLKPNYGDAYANLGALRFKTGHVDQAVLDCTRAIELKPNHVGAHNNRGYAYSELGRYDLAMADFAKALELDPNDANTYDSRALTYCRLKQYDNAWQDVRTCRRLGGTPDPKLLEILTTASGRTE
jgi:tetratricopeptide (TPR) repeat protein